jgi:hypothetical protein
MGAGCNVVRCSLLDGSLAAGTKHRVGERTLTGTVGEHRNGTERRIVTAGTEKHYRCGGAHSYCSGPGPGSFMD